ncbi:MAG TPA: hypothetical protein VKD72_14125 [Gemmataceae bacterium]|nr:hypothetical protein [Gemmataceae bacterium]
MSASHPHDPKADFLAQRGVLHLHPERVQDALFHGRAFFDARDLVQVRYEMVRRYRVDGQKATGVARSFGVSRQLLYLLTSTFRDLGLPALFPRPRGPKGASKCTDEVLTFVRTRQSQSPQLSLDELLADVRQCLGVCLHRRTLQRQLARRGKKRCRSLCPPRQPNPLPSI